MFLFILIFITSCGNQSNDQTFKAASNQLEKSNQNLQIQNANIYQEIENKSTDYRYLDKTNYWEPKAKIIRYSSRDISNLIYKLKLNPTTKQDSLYMHLYKLLTNFKLELTKLTNSLEDEFQKYDPYLSSIFNRDSITSEEFVTEFSGIKSIVKRECILVSIENACIQAENIALNYCNNVCNIIRDYYSEFSVLVSQNSKHFKPNDELIIKAGIGEVTRSAAPIIIIANTKIPLEDNGLAEYKLKVKTDTGKHIIPVNISYTKPDGSKASQTVNVEYQVH